MKTTDVIKLPFKENIPFVSDNYNVTLNRQSKLKDRLSKSTDTLAKYDEVITDQLEHGVIEKVESIGIPKKLNIYHTKQSLETTIAQQSLV